jgi:hypothetical protein
VGILLNILLEILLTILFTVNTVQIGVPTLLDFSVAGLLLTVISMAFGCWHWCRSVKKITIFLYTVPKIYLLGKMFTKRIKV